jgi:Interferon-induced transmembrane protein
MMPGAGGDVNTVLPLILSIFSLLCCWGLGTISGVIGLVFAIQAGGMKTNGDIEGARAKAKLSLIIVGAGMAVSFVLGIILQVAGVFANMQ